MKKMSELLAEMGFKEDSTSSVQQAFLKHLIKAETAISRQNSSLISKQINPSSATPEPVQLSFDNEILKAGNK